MVLISEDFRSSREVNGKISTEFEFGDVVVRLVAVSVEQLLSAKRKQANQ